MLSNILDGLMFLVNSMLSGITFIGSVILQIPNYTIEALKVLNSILPNSLYICAAAFVASISALLILRVVRGGA